MPGTYAHYAFGKKVLAQVDDEIKNIILKITLEIYSAVNPKRNLKITLKLPHGKSPKQRRRRFQ